MNEAAHQDIAVAKRVELGAGLGLARAHDARTPDDDTFAGDARALERFVHRRPLGGFGAELGGFEPCHRNFRRQRRRRVKELASGAASLRRRPQGSDPVVIAERRNFLRHHVEDESVAEKARIERAQDPSDIGPIVETGVLGVLLEAFETPRPRNDLGEPAIAPRGDRVMPALGRGRGSADIEIGVDQLVDPLRQLGEARCGQLVIEMAAMPEGLDEGRAPPRRIGDRTHRGEIAHRRGLGNIREIYRRAQPARLERRPRLLEINAGGEIDDLGLDMGLGLEAPRRLGEHGEEIGCREPLEIERYPDPGSRRMGRQVLARDVASIAGASAATRRIAARPSGLKRRRSSALCT